MVVEEDGNIGANTTTPRKQIDSLSISQAQLRLSYSDNSVYADFQVNSNGNLTISPTGGSLILDSYLKLRVTDTDGTVEGQIWYDASEDKLKFKTAAGVETVTSG